MINKDIFRDHIVIPSLIAIESYSKDAEDIVFETGMVETGLRAVRQYNGPALGLFQMEPATHNDIFANFLGVSSRNYLIEGLQKLSNDVGNYKELEFNPFYAAAMCRIHYLRFKGSIPSHRTGRAAYYKEHYNTPAGKTTVDEYMERSF